MPDHPHNTKFLSTLSLRRATSGQWKYHNTKFYFYPRSPYGERHNRWSQKQHHPHFYPRSPYGERHQNVANGERQKDISIHALLTESDQPRKTEVPGAILFLSTLSLRRATRVDFFFCVLYHYFYPRSPYGERLHAPNRRLYRCNISIHALLTESDILVFCGPQGSGNFYPRSPYGERPIQNHPQRGD